MGRGGCGAVAAATAELFEMHLLNHHRAQLHAPAPPPFGTCAYIPIEYTFLHILANTARIGGGGCCCANCTRTRARARTHTHTCLWNNLNIFHFNRKVSFTTVLGDTGELRGNGSNPRKHGWLQRRVSVVHINCNAIATATGVYSLGGMAG